MPGERPQHRCLVVQFDAVHPAGGGADDDLGDRRRVGRIELIGRIDFQPVLARTPIGDAAQIGEGDAGIRSRTSIVFPY